MNFTKNDVLKVTGAKLLKDNSKQEFFTISTDTRTIKDGELYLPLKGENFDGEQFCQNAINAGALGCFTTGGKFPDNAEIVFKVENTLTSYLQLARFIRRKFNPKVIAITGSSGKTTTKEMVYSVVKEKFKTHKTLSNHNNEVGLCQTVLSMPKDTEVLIVEMGMRGLGEIEVLSKYAEPDYSIITNTGSAHIGRLGSLENIAKAKCEITKYQNPNGILIAHNNERIKDCIDFVGEKIYYSIDDVDVIEKKASYSKFMYKGNLYELNIEGDYNIENSLSAIEIGYQLGMSYKEISYGLLNYRPIEKRWEIEEVGGYKIINDSYNANPESMKAAVSTFIELYPNSVVIMGDMGELGEQEIELHREVGRFIKGNATFLTVGDLAKHIAGELSADTVKSFDTNEDTSRYILENIHAGTTIFLKASRSMKFEEIIEKLRVDS